MADQYKDNVSLFLPFLGENNGTVFTDYSPSPKTVTPYGDAKTVTAESKYYGSSGYFDGTGDYLVVNSSAFQHGARDFTLEFWVNPKALSTGSVFIDGRAVGSEGPQIVVWNGGANKFVLYISGAARITSTTIYTPGAWYHVAIARASGTTRLFVNGVQEGSFSDTYVYNEGRYVIASDRAGGGTFAAAYFQDLRITEGVARYTEDFTPPNALVFQGQISGVIYGTDGLPLADATVRIYSRDTGALLGQTVSGDGSPEVIGDAYYNSISLLLPMSGVDGGTTFTDYSPSPKTITRYGDAKTVTAESKYYGSSGYFDGVADYLGVAMGAGLSMADFTVEMWLRPSTFAAAPGGANQCPFSFGVSSGQGALLLTTSGNVIFYAGSTVLSSTIALTVNTWQHLAFSRSSGTLRAFVGGQAAGSASYSVAVAAATAFIGRSLSSSGDYSGYLQDLRITKGIARYTADFTPPTALYPLVQPAPARPLGEFYSSIMYDGEVQCVALSPDTGSVRNDLIHRAIPVPVE